MVRAYRRSPAPYVGGVHRGQGTLTEGKIESMKLHPATIRLARRGFRGAAADTADTVPTSILMLAAQKAALMEKQLPEKITEAALDEAVQEPVEEAVDEPVENILSVVNHLAFGAAAGATFGIIRRDELPDIGQGIAFGIAVWAVSYQGWIPALNILPPPQRDRRGRPTSMVAAHVVFGAVLGDLVGRFDRD